MITHSAENNLLLLGVLQSVRVMWNLVTLCFDFVPGRSVVFLLTEKLIINMLRVHVTYRYIKVLPVAGREICLSPLTLLKMYLKFRHLT